MELQNNQLSIINHQPKLKVCGLTKLNQIKDLISMKTNFFGFIFYEKTTKKKINHLTLEEIKSIDHQGKVGVFVNENVEKIIDISKKAGLNFIQLHGDENNEYISNLKENLEKNIEIIKVIRIGNNLSEVKNQLKKISNLKSQISNLLFDTDSKSFGGTGKSFDWQILNELKIDQPYFLSGGISEENITQLSRINDQPFSLDINSKFEIDPGNKDLEKIKKFVDELSREATD